MQHRFIFAFLVLFAPFVAAASFPDVSADHEHRVAIDYVREKGMVAGYPDGTFRPDATINRAEFLKILIESKGEGPTACAVPLGFSDVKTADWFHGYLCTAKKNGYVEGYPDGTFRPGKNISYVEAAKLIMNTLYGVQQDPLEMVPWYYSFIDAMEKRSAIPTGVRHLEHEVTRGQMAEMVYRLDAGIDDKPTMTYSALLSGTSEGWKRYVDEDGRFSVDIPDNWIVEGYGDGKGGMWYNVGTKQSMQGGGLFAIYAAPHGTPGATVEELAAFFGDQFDDRKETRSTVSVDGKDALLVTVSTAKYPDWISKIVFVQTDEMLFVVSNGATNDPAFERFYKSFRPTGARVAQASSSSRRSSSLKSSARSTSSDSYNWEFVVAGTATALGEGGHLVELKKGTSVVLPTKAVLTFGSLTLGNGQSVDVVSRMKAHDGGYEYEISSRTCESAEEWHDDYSTLELSKCALMLHVRRIAAPKISYDGFEKRFSSYERQYHSGDPALLGQQPVVNGSNESFVSIVPEYVHLYRSNDWEPGEYGVGTPIGDNVRVYTAYGYVDFVYENFKEDILGTVTKTAEIGPLTLTLVIEKLACHKPYLLADGSCGTDSTVLNRVDFHLTIDHDGSSSDVVLSEYRW